MKSKDTNKVLAQNIVRFLSKNQETQLDLAKRLKVSTSTVSSWCTGEKMPRMDKVDEMADYFGTTRAELLSDPGAYISRSNREAIPLVGRIACGSPILAEENIEEYISLPTGVRADYALTCRGDSMIDAGIHSGDVVYIRACDDVDDGQIAVVLIGDNATLKRVYHLRDGVMLMAENPARERHIYQGEAAEAAGVRIKGQAVAFLHKLT